MEMSMEEGRAYRIAAVERDLARLVAMDEALQAAAVGIRPAMLARNLIRLGLSAPSGSLDGVALAGAVERVEEAVRELRALVP